MQSALFRYGLSVVAVALATAVRLFMDPLLGESLPLPTFLIAVALSVWYIGEGPALAATFLGYLAINLFLTGPRGALALATTVDALAMGLYFVTCILLIGLGSGLRRARAQDAKSRAETLERQKQLREIEERLHVAQMAAHWGIFDYDLVHGELYWSPELEALYGLQPGEFEGTYEAWIRRIHPDDRRHIEAQANPVAPSEYLWQDFRVVWPDGSVHWLNARAKVVRDQGGRPMRILGANSDITERKRAEEALADAAIRLSAIVDTAVDGIITIDEHGIIDSANTAVERIFGYPVHEVIGHNISILMPEPYRSQHDRYLANYLHTGERKIIGIGREVRGRRRDGSEFPLELAVSETRLAGQRLFTGIVRDITERHVAHEALKLADRRKDEFLAQLAHELRNPLAPIVTALETARLLGTQTEEQAVIQRQVSHLTRLIDDLLDVSRITRGKFEVRKERLDLGSVVQAAVEACRPSIEQKGQQFMLELPAHPVHVDGDLVRLTQVCTNLLNNAVKFTEAGGRISLKLEQQDKQAVLRIADTGVGIPEADVLRVFEIFFQGDHASGETRDGLGIGLFLVKRLVELHGGTVAASRSRHGAGSEFTVWLPVAEAPELQPGAAAASASTSDDGAAGRCRILVVDDNRDAADSLATLLRLNGHDVATAYDGPEAVTAAGEFRPDVILLDLGLPGTDGYQVCDQIRAQPWGKEMLIVALTGWGREEDRARTRTCGFNAHLVKPVDPAELEGLLRGVAANCDEDPDKRQPARQPSGPSPKHAGHRR